jgi:hypothetical protein
MQALVIRIVAGLLRAALGGASAYLINRGIATDDQIGELVAGIAVALVTAGWTAWDKIITARQKNTALAAAPGTTMAQVDASVKAGTFAAATTPKDEVPVITRRIDLDDPHSNI